MQQPGKPITSTHNLTLLNSIFEYISDPNKEPAASNPNKCHIKINIPKKKKGKKKKTTPEKSLLPFALQLVCGFNTFPLLIISSPSNHSGLNMHESQLKKRDSAPQTQL